MKTRLIYRNRFFVEVENSRNNWVQVYHSFDRMEKAKEYLEQRIQETSLLNNKNNYRLVHELYLKETIEDD